MIPANPQNGAMAAQQMMTVEDAALVGAGLVGVNIWFTRATLARILATYTALASLQERYDEIHREWESACERERATFGELKETRTAITETRESLDVAKNIGNDALTALAEKTAECERLREQVRLQCGTFTLTDEQKQELWDAAMKAKAERAQRLPDVAACLCAIRDGHARLIELGWRDASYAPADSSPLHLIEAGSTGIHDGYRDAERRFWITGDGDLWPSRPILFRPTTPSPEDRK